MEAQRAPAGDRPGGTPAPGRSPWPPFVIALGLVLLLAVSALFAGIALSAERAIDAEVDARARTLFGSIVLARKWNALHGGVWVEKRPGVESNRLLPSPDVATVDGRLFTLRNPALMAREMAALAEGSDLFRFRITSLRPLNPRNFPDDFEAQALAAFEAGRVEVSRRERFGDSTWLRYMAPLRVEESCLACHGAQGYRVGDVRGGISVAFPIDAAEAGKARARRNTFLLFLATLVLLAAVIWRLVAGLRRRLAEAGERIRQMAITDELTGLRNRRYALQRLDEEFARAQRNGRPLSVAIFDVDRFKQVNDRHGHAAGDDVLRAVAAMAGRACRASDLLARYGGEEFLAILPETGAAGARAIAERIRAWLEAMRVDHGALAITVTASFGTATLDPAGVGPPDGAGLVRLADEALYRAKALGRNRVEPTP
jgi:diguanylate cyclase (GGDEF)-like protein